METLKISFVVVAAIAAIGLNSARADQPHIKAALEHLRAARAELKSAEANKGGNSEDLMAEQICRARAVANVDKAIADVEKGMTFAK